jgi:phosphoribosyl 1,2-cyclic phosphodiesterase
VRLQFCGVRGSTPAPGADFVRVGGNTSCVAVWPQGSPVPRLVLDAGTGIRYVTPLLEGRAFDGTILLSHLHWDHVQGLPFFAAADRDDAATRLVMPDAGVDAATELARAMSPPHFPIGPEGLCGTWGFHSMGEGWHQLEGLRVLAREVPHKGGRTFGYRVEDDVGSLAYVPDHLPSNRPADRDRILDLIERVDVLVHDAQFLAAESAMARDYGHSTVDQVLALAAEAGVGRLVLFHHAPFRTDAQIDRLVATLRPTAFGVEAAIETGTIDVAPVVSEGPGIRRSVTGRS